MLISGSSVNAGLPSVLVPLIGILFYMIFRPEVTARDVPLLTRAEKAVSGVPTADELAKLSELRKQGVPSGQIGRLGRRERSKTSIRERRRGHVE